MPSYLTLLLLLSGNADETCLLQEKPDLLRVQLPGFESYKLFSVVLFVIMIGLCCILAFISYGADTYDENKSKHHETQETLFTNTTTICGWREVSDEAFGWRVPCTVFFLSESAVGWMVALVTVATQVCMVSPVSFFVTRVHVRLVSWVLVIGVIFCSDMTDKTTCSPAACSIHQSCWWVLLVLFHFELQMLIRLTWTL